MHHPKINAKKLIKFQIFLIYEFLCNKKPHAIDFTIMSSPKRELLITSIKKANLFVSIQKGIKLIAAINI